MEWKTIETAPKDGTEVLVSGLNYGEQGKGTHQTIAHWVGGIGWTEGNYMDDGLLYLTHWMPLPEPPK